jgi:hypothetical protein
VEKFRNYTFCRKWTKLPTTALNFKVPSNILAGFSCCLQSLWLVHNLKISELSSQTSLRILSL